MPEKKIKSSKKQPEKNIGFSLNIKEKTWRIIFLFFWLIAFLLPLYYVFFAQSVNNYLSFPLDDPWIHLQFAKNLAEYGSFSYFRNEVVTAGSTSPIYTLILSLFFLFTKNEMWLSYIIGAVFFSVAVFYFLRLSLYLFDKENWLAICAAAIFLLDRWMNLIAVTGMETTLFIFLLIACYYYYLQRKAEIFAVILGLTLWTRPDAVAFIGAVAVDYLIVYYLKKTKPEINRELKLFEKKQLIRIALITSGIISAYFLMNYIISGSILPNTYGAKTVYYSLKSRSEFLKYEVWGYFTESVYVFFFAGFVVALVKIISDVIKMKYNPYLLAFVFITALIFIYWYKLPYAHRFGRYLMPVIPFYILLFVYGLREFFRFVFEIIKDVKSVNFLNFSLIAVVIIYSAYVYFDHRKLYAEQSRHIYSRQVVTAKWLKENTPEDAIIATHDVGAIAFYSERKIIDVVGLINPEFIDKIHTRNFNEYMEEELKNKGVTYIAFLREWFQVVNQKKLFTAGDQNFEIMEVYKFVPGKTHILNMEANGGIEYAGKLLAQKQYQQAISVLKQVATIDPKSSLTYYMIAYTYSLMGDVKSSEANLKKAIEIYPDYKEALTALVHIYRSQNKNQQAKEELEKYIKNNPSDTEIENLYQSLRDTVTTR
ncbi:MAG: tetratricopeptide repeat protein [Ignavibacteria bacterium]|nr:tetratricopeptide repeat protein [Ignavibacteria bacterium]